MSELGIAWLGQWALPTHSPAPADVRPLLTDIVNE
jgi:hypothetical protein